MSMMKTPFILIEKMNRVFPLVLLQRRQLCRSTVAGPDGLIAPWVNIYVTEAPKLSAVWNVPTAPGPAIQNTKQVAAQ